MGRGMTTASITKPGQSTKPWSRIDSQFLKAALVTVMLGALPWTASAQNENDAVVERLNNTEGAVEHLFQDPLGGVVVNRTVTVLGKDFYRYFSTRWRQSDEATRYSISIHERPTARFGSEIWVLYRQQRMFHIFLPPARAATRGISEVAVQQVLDNISQRELERRTTRNPDLGPEEL